MIGDENAGARVIQSFRVDDFQLDAEDKKPGPADDAAIDSGHGHIQRKNNGEDQAQNAGRDHVEDDEEPANSGQQMRFL